MLRLRYWREDARGTVVSAVVQLDAKYQSGLEGNHANPHLEDVRSHLRSTRRISRRQPAGGWLALSTTVASTNRIAQRSAVGLWASLGTGASGAVLALAYRPDGTVYAAVVQQHGRVANTNGIAQSGTAAPGRPWARAPQSAARSTASRSMPAARCMPPAIFR